jgi:CMP-N-acetylneuraminate monooxygenase
MKTKISAVSILKKLPISININDDPYILSETTNGIILFSAICPHQHNVVSELEEDCWRCPSHEWTFDSNSGCSINAPTESLTQFPVFVEDGFLFVKLPEKNTQVIKKISGEKIFPKITLVGNASILVQWKSYNFLFDPWIEGPAVFGSWITYPPSNISVKDLPEIHGIFISHEHSDHFHEFTLKKFNRNIPVFVPNFDNRRLESRLKKLGFTNITSLNSGEEFQLSEKIYITSFSSGSVWNDSIFFMQLGSFSMLNINDAGFNWSLKNLIKTLDLLCIQFSPASGYPATWNHMNEKSKLDLMHTRNSGMLKMIQQLVKILNPKMVLPFANFNQLYLPEHKKFVETQPRNSPQSVVDALKGYDVKVLNITPGESWDGTSNIFNRKNKMFENKNLLETVIDDIDFIEKNKKFIPTFFDLKFDDIKNYFEQFHNSEISKEIGDYDFILDIVHQQKIINVIIKFRNGNIICENNKLSSKISYMYMKCPGPIVQEIIKNDLSWDELQSGYWCEFDRNPDFYNIGLWKLLHAPWRARPYFEKNKTKLTKITDKTSIADIIENGDEETIKTLEKFGLYCAGCEAAIGENLKDGCSIHGLTDDDTSKLISEIKKSSSNN